jgi:hypothetical protein
MKELKPIATIATAAVATLLMSLAGCVSGGSYAGEGPYRDGGVVVVGGYDRGGHGGDNHPQAYHAEAAHQTVAAASDRGRVSAKPPAAGGERASTDDRK